MAIRTQADAGFFSKRPEERELARRLDEAFDVTFGNSHGGFSYWFADPKQHTKERFGLSQEVLVIFSPFAKTDARVLTTIEDISRRPEFRYRLDKVLSILIHKSDQKETSALLSTQTDRVVVSFRSDELLDPGRGSLFVRTRMAETVSPIDLFGMSSPIKSDAHFFGRGPLVDTLLARATARRENTGLFGLRKTGKTSVLNAVQRRLQGRGVLAEYVDCQSPGIHADRWWSTLRALAQRFSSNASTNHSGPAFEVKPYEEVQAGSRFLSDVKRILETSQADQILVMLDEIEYITYGLSGRLGNHWDQDIVPFLQTLRATHHELDGRLTFIVAGVNPALVGHLPCVLPIWRGSGRLAQ